MSPGKRRGTECVVQLPASSSYFAARDSSAGAELVAGRSGMRNRAAIAQEIYPHIC